MDYYLVLEQFFNHEKFHFGARLNKRNLHFRAALAQHKYHFASLVQVPISGAGIRLCNCYSIMHAKYPQQPAVLHWPNYPSTGVKQYNNKLEPSLTSCVSTA